MNIVFALALLLPLAASSSAQAPSTQPAKGPLDSYKAYLEVMATAKSLDDLLPYYTKELRDGLAKMPADMKVSYLQMNRRVLKELKVTSENVGESKAEFRLAARTADGQATQGSVTMIKEGDAWKIDEDAWIGPPAKKDRSPTPAQWIVPTEIKAHTRVAVGGVPRRPPQRLTRDTCFWREEPVGLPTDRTRQMRFTSRRSAPLES